MPQASHRSVGPVIAGVSIFGEIVKIREAQTKDAVAIKNLVSSLSSFYLQSKNSQLPEWFKKTLEESEFERRISSQDFKNYVYCNDEKIVGYVSVKGNNHLYHLFVLKEHQGNGIAKALWRHVLENTHEELYVVRSSIYAIPVYKRFGFVESGRSMSKDGISFQPMELVTKC